MVTTELHVFFFVVPSGNHNVSFISGFISAVEIKGNAGGKLSPGIRDVDISGTKMTHLTFK